MKDHEITLYGKSNAAGQLKMNSQELNQFVSKWTNERFMITIKVLPEKPSHAIRTYYYEKIVPDFIKVYREVQGIYYTKENMDLELLKLYPPNHIEMTREETGGFKLSRVRSFHDMSNAEASDYLMFLKQVASVEFDLYIDDNTIKELAQ